MIDQIDPAPNDHILLLSIDMPLVVFLAERLTNGLLVGLAGADAVAEARKATRDLQNVMFHPGSADEIPFRDGFFQKVVGPAGQRAALETAAREIVRVLAPGGRLYLPPGDELSAAVQGLGLKRAGEHPDLAVWARE